MLCMQPHPLKLRRFYLTGDMTNLYPRFIVLLWNQYKYIAFNIFSSIILIISFKMLISTGVCNKKANELTMYVSKRHNILPTKTSFFIASEGKTGNIQ